jgi:GNAT superfamily N-acetyltransferase
MPVHESRFDSDHFGLKIGRLAPTSVAELHAALEDAHAARFDVLFVRVSLEAREVCDALDAEPLETLVTLAMTDAAVPPARGHIRVEHHDRVDRDEDIAAIARITSDAIQRTHFHNDPRLPLDATRRLYAAWATNDVRGRAQRTIIARDGDRVLGYITVMIDGASAVIDLVAVDPALHGRGIGSEMLASFVGWARERSLAARVGTQATNPALALYQRFGFVPARRDNTYHVWLRS